MFLTPIADARGQDSDISFHALASHDTVIDAISWEIFPIYCLEGDTLSGEFRIVSNGDLFPGDQTKYDIWLLEGVDFLILDEDNYNLWLEESTAAPILEKKSLVELEWSVEIPHSSTWYVVYSNDSLFMMQVEGTIVRSSPNSVFFLVIGITGVASVLILILVYLLVPRWKK